jgi:hypothetical protein
MKDETIQTDFRPETALWSIQQVAIYLAVRPRTIRNLMARGELVRRQPQSHSAHITRIIFEAGSRNSKKNRRTREAT